MILVTHNVYWFQGCPPRAGRERAAEFPGVREALARLYAAHAPDALFLQEVHRADLAEAVARALGLPAVLHAPGGRRPEYGGCVAGRAAARLRNAGAEGEPPDRVHLRAALPSPDGPVELAALHLPSNRYAAGPAEGEAARLAELERALALAPRPDVIAGDLNARPGSAPCRRLAEAGYVDAAAAAGVEDARAHRVEYVWLDARLAQRLMRFAVLDGGDFVRTAPDGETWRLSDHPPLLVEWR